MNAINAFQGLETDSQMKPIPGVGTISMMSSHVSDARFERTVIRVIYPMILDKDRDAIFKEKVSKLDKKQEDYADSLWHEINELLERNQFWKRISRVAHL